MRHPRWDRGSEFLGCDPACDYESDWFLDRRVEGLCHHATRAHIAGDLHRYLYASCFAKAYGRSPSLRDFPAELLPNHENARDALDGGLFADRFRVQLRDRPASTITSHIGKDGHYYIHYDPTQCRSLTVREAARIQTFPDNYFFCGPRTEQYVQVGNAVPPLLAVQIADVVKRLVEDAGCGLVQVPWTGFRSSTAAGTCLASEAENTSPERRCPFHYCIALGLRFRLHHRGLPGTPDIVLTRFGDRHFCAWLLLAPSSTAGLHTRRRVAPLSGREIRRKCGPRSANMPRPPQERVARNGNLGV